MHIFTGGVVIFGTINILQPSGCSIRSLATEHLRRRCSSKRRGPSSVKRKHWSSCRTGFSRWAGGWVSSQQSMLFGLLGNLQAKGSKAFPMTSICVSSNFRSNQSLEVENDMGWRRGDMYIYRRIDRVRSQGHAKTTYLQQAIWLLGRWRWAQVRWSSGDSVAAQGVLEAWVADLRGALEGLSAHLIVAYRHEVPKSWYSNAWLTVLLGCTKYKPLVSIGDVFSPVWERISTNIKSHGWERAFGSALWVVYLISKKTIFLHWTSI